MTTAHALSATDARVVAWLENFMARNALESDFTESQLATWARSLRETVLVASTVEEISQVLPMQGPGEATSEEFKRGYYAAKTVAELTAAGMVEAVSAQLERAEETIAQAHDALDCVVLREGSCTARAQAVLRAYVGEDADGE